MDKKTTGIVAYITLVGWIIAYCAGDKEGAKFHLNQALVLWIGQLICSVVTQITFVGALVGGVLNIVLLVFWVVGLILACKEEEKELPLIGGIKILK